jgi:hypothetical protein
MEIVAPLLVGRQIGTEENGLEFAGPEAIDDGIGQLMPSYHPCLAFIGPEII